MIKLNKSFRRKIPFEIYILRYNKSLCFFFEIIFITRENTVYKYWFTIETQAKLEKHNKVQ